MAMPKLAEKMSVFHGTLTESQLCEAVKMSASQPNTFAMDETDPERARMYTYLYNMLVTKQTKQVQLSGKNWNLTMAQDKSITATMDGGTPAPAAPAPAAPIPPAPAAPPPVV